MIRIIKITVSLSSLKHLFLWLLISIWGLGTFSCDYLDVVPDNVATIEYAFANRNTAEKFLYTCYNDRLPVGDLNGDPARGSDETMQRAAMGMSANIFTSSYLARGLQNVSLPYFDNWRTYYKAIRNCNIFLEEIPNVQVDMREGERTRWIAEAKFLKAYYHWLLLRQYGPVSIVDVNLPLSASVEEVKLYRDPLEDVVEYIVATLEDALTGLPEERDMMEGTEAGRANKLVALTLMADVRLWAASPLVNSDDNLYSNMIDNRDVRLFPGSYDENKWRLAAEAAERAIEACHAAGKQLYREIEARTYNQNEVFQHQTMLRQIVCKRWNYELIWGSTSYDAGWHWRNCEAKVMGFNSDGLNTTIHAEYSPTMKMVESFYSSNGVPINEDKVWAANGWYVNRYGIRPGVSSGNETYYVKEGQQTVYLHYNREPRFYAGIGFDQGIYFGAGYYSFPSDVKHLNFRYMQPAGYFPQGFSCTGYSAKKFAPYETSQTYTAIGSPEYFPFPIYRLAELYLMYAEAYNELEGPNGAHSDRVFGYLDAIRSRAGLDGVKRSWAEHASIDDRPTRSKEDLRDIIRRERTVELMFESKRFWDVRRWRLIDELNEQPQGWNYMGRTAEEFYSLQQAYPEQVGFSVKDYFWPIRESNLFVNENLIQNYGW
ncbi:MAG: RagB/SusD family nutrient uptake outer membrane protein [Bacteroidales bacterium]|jgi:hypothetical protein|nr:RagB/SusD family nutrient uptake outer membrane protein [Bacteroidales bacterium]